MATISKRWTIAALLCILAMVAMVLPAYADEEPGSAFENEDVPAPTIALDVVNIDELVSAQAETAVNLVWPWSVLEGQTVSYAIGSSDEFLAYFFENEWIEDYLPASGDWAIVLTHMSRNSENVMTIDDLAEGEKIASATCYVLFDRSLSCEEVDQALQAMFDVRHIVAMKRTERSNVSGTFVSVTGYGSFAIAPLPRSGMYVLAVTFVTPNIGDKWYSAEKRLFDQMYSGNSIAQAYAMVKR